MRLRLHVRRVHVRRRQTEKVHEQRQRRSRQQAKIRSATVELEISLDGSTSGSDVRPLPEQWDTRREIGGRSLTTRCTDRGSRSDLVPSLHCAPAVHRLPRPQGSLSNPFISGLLPWCYLEGSTLARGLLRESDLGSTELWSPRVGSWASAQYSATLVNCSTTPATAGWPL